jgi:hypothetical protein
VLRQRVHAPRSPSEDGHRSRFGTGVCRAPAYTCLLLRTGRQHSTRFHLRQTASRLPAKGFCLTSTVSLARLAGCRVRVPASRSPVSSVLAAHCFRTFAAVRTCASGFLFRSEDRSRVLDTPRRHLASLVEPHGLRRATLRRRQAPTPGAVLRRSAGAEQCLLRPGCRTASVCPGRSRNVARA